jgi:hypothetical protein
MAPSERRCMVRAFDPLLHLGDLKCKAMFMPNFFVFVQRQATRTETWVSLCSFAFGTGVMSWAAAQWHALAAQGWAAIFIVALLSSGIILGAAALLFLSISKWRELKNPSANGIFNHDALVHIIGQQFQNTTVILDGYFYDDCAFDYVTFKWEGGNFRVSGAHNTGFIRLRTDNHIVVTTIDLLREFNLLKPDFANSWQHIPHPPPEKSD